MKQNKLFGVLAIALSLALVACGNAGGDDSKAAEECKKHTWGDWEVVQPATCTEDGSQKRTCSVCGKEETKAIKAAHTWGEWVTTTPATCQAEGAKERECSVCHTKENGTVPKADHTWGEWIEVSAATCTEAGSHKHVCSVCQTEETETINALGHEWGDWVETLAPTCDKAGSHKHTCTRCNAEESEEVAALGHDLQLVGGEQAAPSGEATVRVYKCTRCNETSLGFKADEPSAESLPHLMVGDNGGMRFFGRPIGNALALSENGTSVNQQNNECVYCSTETGDFFEYVFTLNATQAATLATCRLYCDARPADHLSGDFWAYGRSATDWTPGYYIDGADEHVQHNEDGTVMMVNDHAKSVYNAENKQWDEGVALETQVAMGARIEDYRYVLYVDDVIQQFDEDTAVPAEGSSTNMVRKEYVLPFTFHLHEGKNKISLRMAGGYRSEFYNFIFRPYVEPTQIVVNQTSLEIEEGKTAQITSSMEGLTYASSSNSVATVDANGVVTAVKAGNATITVSKEGNFKAAKVAVKVVEVAGTFQIQASEGVIAPEGSIEVYTSTYGGGTRLRNFQKDSTLTFTFDSAVVGNFKLIINARGSNVTVADHFSIKVNGEDVAISGSYNSANSGVDTIIGQVALKASGNVLVITTISENCPINLHYVKFIPAA